jgi:hypothetical protein
VSSNTPNQAANASPPNDTSTTKSVPSTGEWLRTAVDVEYTPTEIDYNGESLLSTSRTREDINDPTLTTAELITDLNDGPRRRRRQTSRQTVVACDPEGPNQSIFKSNMPNKRQIWFGFLVLVASLERFSMEGMGFCPFGYMPKWYCTSESTLFMTLGVKPLVMRCQLGEDFF